MIRLFERLANAQLKRQRNDLLAANVRFEQRARDAEAEAARLRRLVEPTWEDDASAAIGFHMQYGGAMEVLAQRAKVAGFRVEGFTTNAAIPPCLVHGKPLVQVKDQRGVLAVAVSWDE